MTDKWHLSVINTPMIEHKWHLSVINVVEMPHNSSFSGITGRVCSPSTYARGAHTPCRIGSVERQKSQSSSSVASAVPMT